MQNNNALIKVLFMYSIQSCGFLHHPKYEVKVFKYLNSISEYLKAELSDITVKTHWSISLSYTSRDT